MTYVDGAYGEHIKFFDNGCTWCMRGGYIAIGHWLVRCWLVNIGHTHITQLISRCSKGITFDNTINSDTNCLSKWAKNIDADKLLKFVKTLEFCEVVYLLYSLMKIHGSWMYQSFKSFFIKSVVDKLEWIVPLIKKTFLQCFGTSRDQDQL